QAIAEYRAAIRMEKDYPEAHTNLGAALLAKGRLDEAIDQYREATASRHVFPEAYKAHVNLGNALQQKGHWDEALAEYRAAIRLSNDCAMAHWGLGVVCLQKGQFQTAVQELRRGHELGSRDPHWPFPSAQWLRQAEALARLDARLPAFLN